MFNYPNQHSPHQLKQQLQSFILTIPVIGFSVGGTTWMTVCCQCAVTIDRWCSSWLMMQLWWEGARVVGLIRPRRHGLRDFSECILMNDDVISRNNKGWRHCWVGECGGWGLGIDWGQVCNKRGMYWCERNSASWEMEVVCIKQLEWIDWCYRLTRSGQKWKKEEWDSV